MGFLFSSIIMATHLPSKKPSLRLIQLFRWAQPVCRLSSSKSTRAGSHTLLKCSQMPEIQLPPALCSSEFSTYRYPCPATCTTRSPLSPQIRGWLVPSTHQGDHKGKCPQPILHSALSRQQRPADVKQATQTYSRASTRMEHRGTWTLHSVLKCSYHVKFPPIP